MFATHPQTPFKNYTPILSSPLSHTTPIWTMSPTRNASQTPNLSNPPPIFNIQTEPIIRHTQTNHTPIAMNFNASASSTPPTSNQFSNPQTSPTPRPKPKYEARYASIANPLKDKAGLARSRTRTMFLNRVRNERDDGRFEARGEQMMRMEHLADRRRWEERMAREGEGVVGFEEDDMLPDDALDEFISQEEAMEMAIRETQGGRERNGDVPFSDDEYDDIFMGLSERGNQALQSQDMDMS
ncbi:hypothetical protein N7491_004976 [Penicillium cf. griseofulvum]|uniref:Uncharacterized protein n=1 Tax=Penicillium cf. griseofulvum TaxID=2972120 RepID=A0A9W9J6P9_9EURO|nr:hypothetical protein N7472_007670 [Penicillium cf. griseofulvum]KAJ5434381.1 hypothetical protein N7491_004976 [Penicillium cf. griseofulvum]